VALNWLQTSHLVASLKQQRKLVACVIVSFRYLTNR